MKFPQKLAGQFYDKMAVMGGTLGVLLPTSPLHMPFAYRDSGVFLYIGWQILRGALPYRDVWDHKPPVVFYLNALGLALAHGSRWGVWLLEFFSLCIAVRVGYKLLQKVFGTIPALCSTVLWLLTLSFVIQGGNLTTEYTLPLQFITLWIAVTTFEKPTLHMWDWFLMGILGAMAFFTKQTTIGIWLSVMGVRLAYRVKSRQLQELALESITFLSGAAAVGGAWIVFFGLQGGLTYWWSATFAFNFVYASSTPSLVEHFKPILMDITPLVMTGLLPWAGMGYLLALVGMNLKRNLGSGGVPLLFIGLFDLPIEFMLLSVSGRTYPHYYMSILPVLALFAGMTFWVMLSSPHLRDLSALRRSILTLGIVAILLWTSLNPYKTQVASLKNVAQQSAIIREIERMTRPDDKVLLWGAETAINYFSRRESPTRFVYQYPLYTPGYVDESMILEFLDDVILNRPQLIIDTHNPRTPLYDFPIQTRAIQERISYLECHYRMVGALQGWTFYEYTAGACFP